jgi:hypothetical protein
MFDFKEVRKEIENRLIQEKKNEQIWRFDGWWKHC